MGARSPGRRNTGAHLVLAVRGHFSNEMPDGKATMLPYFRKDFRPPHAPKFVVLRTTRRVPYAK